MAISNYYGKQAEDNRTRELQKGGQIDSQLQDQLNSRYGLESGYRGTADQLYQNLQQTPGYTEQQKSDILQKEGLQALPTSQDSLNNNYLNADEQGAISGDPGKARNAFDAETLRNAQNDEQSRVTDAVDKGTNNTRATIDPSKLGISDNYTSGQKGALSTTQNNVRAAIDPSKLGLSNAYNDQYNFGAKDQQDMVLGAERGIGQATQAQEDNISRSAAASGYNSPMAMAAAQERLKSTGEVNSADAALNAKIQAKRLGLDVTQTKENTRLGQADTVAGLNASNEQELGAQALNTGQQQENTRLGANQYLTGTQNATEQANANRDVASQLRLGENNVGTQENLNATGINLEQNIDKAASDRALAQATNRQGVNVNNQQTQYGQGAAVNSALSNRYGQIAGQDLSGQAQARNYYTGQQQYQGGQGTTAQGQQINNLGTTYGLANQSTGIAANYNLGRQKVPGTFDKIVGAVSGAAAGFVP